MVAFGDLGGRHQLEPAPYILGARMLEESIETLACLLQGLQ